MGVRVVHLLVHLILRLDSEDEESFSSSMILAFSADKKKAFEFKDQKTV